MEKVFQFDEDEEVIGFKFFSKFLVALTMSLIKQMGEN